MHQSFCFGIVPLSDHIFSVWVIPFLSLLPFPLLPPIPLPPQIHKQAPPLEDIAADCSRPMRSFLERALARDPALRSSASQLLREEAINPPREEQPRCWSLDSAMEDASHPLLRQHSQQPDTTQGRQGRQGALTLHGH